ncbi:MAG: glycosyltransferase family 39 protein [bacterium]|nr:glycosyltransferase family 39 protein [bacterium]
MLSSDAQWSRGRVFGTFILVWALLFLFRLGYMELAFNEVRRVYPALTMLSDGHWLTPVFNGQPYYRKPPLMNWLVAFSVGLGGRNEFFCRLPSALSLVPLLALLAFHRGAWLSLRGRLWAGLVLMTAVGVLRAGRFCEVDMGFAVCAGCAILLWLDNLSVEREGWRLWVPAGVALGLGMLFKGPLILLVFYVTACAVLRRRRCLSLLWSPGHAAGLTVALGIFSSWLAARAVWGEEVPDLAAAAASKVPLEGDMWHIWWIELSQRIFPLGQNDRFFSFSRWLRGLVGGPALFLPWLALVPLLWLRADKTPDDGISRGLRDALVLLTILILAMPLTKARYLLPVFPVAAFALALLLERLDAVCPPVVLWWRRLLLVLRWLLPLLALAGLVGLAALWLLRSPLSSRLILLAALVTWQQVLLSALALALAVLFVFWAGRSCPRPAKVSSCMAVTVAALVVLMLFWQIFHAPFDRSRDIMRSIARQTVAGLQAGDVVGTVGISLGKPLHFYLPAVVRMLNTSSESRLRWELGGIRRVITLNRRGVSPEDDASILPDMPQFLRESGFLPMGSFQNRDGVYMIWDRAVRPSMNGNRRTLHSSFVPDTQKELQ